MKSYFPNNLMMYFGIAFVAIVVFALVFSCTMGLKECAANGKSQAETETIRFDGVPGIFHVIEIDGTEYVAWKSYSGGVGICKK